MLPISIGLYEIQVILWAYGFPKEISVYRDGYPLYRGPALTRPNTEPQPEIKTCC